MSYGTDQLWAQVRERLTAEPRISLLALASELKVERHTLERAARLFTGASFREYQQAALVRAAVDRVCSQPHLSIKEIAVSLGYESPRSLARLFQQHLNATPTEIRRSRLAQRKVS